jgi:hypothetical protein
MRHYAAAQSERNQVDYRVETVEFHRRLDLPILFVQPGVQASTRVAIVIDQKPALFSK